MCKFNRAPKEERCLKEDYLQTVQCTSHNPNCLKKELWQVVYILVGINALKIINSKMWMREAAVLKNISHIGKKFF